MNVVLDTGPNKIDPKRKALYIGILIICLLAILISAYVVVFKNDSSGKVEHRPASEEEYLKRELEFEDIFTNETVNQLNQNILITNKIKKDDDIIGIAYESKEKVIGKYTLNIKIPYINGQQLLKEIRKESDVPIIMVTSKNTEMDEVLSMSYGADDYITKPYNPILLLLRIEAILKRVNKSNNNLSYNNVKVNLLKSTLEYEDRELLLSKNEMSIFYFMLMNKGKIVSRDAIMNYLWGNDRFIDDNTLTVNINRLRKKLEEIDLKGVIETRREQGYILI